MQAMHVLRWAIRLAALVVGVAGLADRGQADPKPPSPATTQVEFNRDIRPLLSDACFQCHGPDSAKRQADLRLDLEAGAKADLGGRAALVPGDVSQSELYQRLVAEDPVERMPPAKSGKSLTAAQIELIRRWIEQGAPWQAHWSFLPPRRPELPAVSQERWVRANIDRFVLARLEKEGLIPAPEADRTTLIRRVSLDLTGLPPTPDEVDAFLNDSADDAYENVVDRLLASERYGERMAVRWLDGARYADTSGYQSDGERYMWRWRDWVIAAYNRNLPFDQFTIEQLAGDLLPAPSDEQRLATAFHRNTLTNNEGGTNDEEFRNVAIVDRVNTTLAVWMGTTVSCCQCHNHKYDP
ncbi:MAG: DUF1549 domain-containing protein, partial [Planctomycetales bacterium]